MTLNAILDDINDGVTDGITPIDGIGNSDDLSLENIRGVVVTAGKHKIAIPKLESGLVEKFNHLYRICTLKQTVKDLKIVDRNIVLEGLAALPVRSPIHEAKLTTGASAINKKILDDIVFSGKDEIPPDLAVFIQETFSVLNQSLTNEVKDLIDTLVKVVDDIRPLIQSKYKTSIIMYNNRSINLLSDDLSEIAYTVNDTELMFDKYSGQLNNKAKEIISSGLYEYLRDINDISEGTQGKDCTFIGVIQTVDFLIAYLRGVATTIEEFLASAKFYLDKNDPSLTGAVADVVEKLPRAITSVDNYNKVRDTITDDLTLFKSLFDYIQFID